MSGFDLIVFILGTTLVGSLFVAWLGEIDERRLNKHFDEAVDLGNGVKR